MNNDIGSSFQKLMFDAFYRYRGYRAEKRPDGTLLVANSIMAVNEFHEWVDGLHDVIEKAVQKSLNILK